jgi:hypothetical protein
MLCYIIAPANDVDLKSIDCISLHSIHETALKRWLPSAEEKSELEQASKR